MAKIEWPEGRYRLNQKAYMRVTPDAFESVCMEGQEIVYRGKPGPHMEPLDDNARRAVAMAAKMPKGAPAPGAEVIAHAASGEYRQPLERPPAATAAQADPDPNTVDIPLDWRSRSWQWQKSTAAKLTSDPVRDKDDAIAAIEAELLRRGAAGPADSADDGDI